MILILVAAQYKCSLIWILHEKECPKLNIKQLDEAVQCPTSAIQWVAHTAIPSKGFVGILSRVMTGRSIFTLCSSSKGEMNMLSNVPDWQA